MPRRESVPTITRPARENAAAKALRLLIEGRVEVRHVSANEIVAKVRGDTAAVYLVTWCRGVWRCTCPARGRCSHLLGVQRVVVTERSGRD